MRVRATVFIVVILKNLFYVGGHTSDVNVELLHVHFTTIFLSNYRETFSDTRAANPLPFAAPVADLRSSHPQAARCDCRMRHSSPSASLARWWCLLHSTA